MKIYKLIINVTRQISGKEIIVNPYNNEIFITQKDSEKLAKDKGYITESDISSYFTGTGYLPLNVGWELTDKCSLKCPFCFIVGHSDNKLVRFEQMRPHLVTLLEKGMLKCTLTGGEPMLHPDFKEIYKFLKTNGCLVEIYTNATLIDNEIHTLLKKYKPYNLEVSIYGLTKSDFDITAGNASKKFTAKKVLNTILQLKEDGINIICKTPLTSLTENSIPKIQNWCVEHALPFYYATNIYDGYDGVNLQNFKASKDKLIKYATDKIRLESNFLDGSCKTNDTVKDCFSCGVRLSSLYINSAFQIMPCDEFKYEDAKFSIIKYGIDEAISKARGFVNKFLDKKVDNCSGCFASNTCTMCAAKAIPIRNDTNEIVNLKVNDEYCIQQRLYTQELESSLLTN